MTSQILIEIKITMNENVSTSPVNNVNANKWCKTVYILYVETPYSKGYDNI